MERSTRLLVAILGIWKAGAAYLPLDPAAPRTRELRILAASGARLVISDDTNDAFAEASVRTLPMGDQRSAARATPVPDRDVTSPDALAYLIYTSGSTGEPKGVEVSHGAVMNVIRGMAKEIGFRSDDVWLSVTLPTFDISVMELFLPLVLGGSVFLAHRESLTTRTRFERLLTASGATVMQATPSQWRMLTSTGWNGTPGLRILCGGEVLSSSLADELAVRRNELWNLYGPTEATIWTTAERYRARRQTPSVEYTPPPIGRPLPNIRVYVLDRWMRPLPPAAIGEIYIGGQGIARGYHDAPALTADRFPPDPFCGEPGRRMYRTGDFGTFTRAGLLRFIGRRDDQVKLLGHRVELGEIEAALKGFASLSDVAVAVAPRRAGPVSDTTRDAVPAGDHLVAYGIPAAGTQPTVSDMQRYLQDKLPKHMVPSQLVLVDALPLTANGKLDRRRLADIPLPAHDQSDAFVPPRTDKERLLARIWSETLGLDRVGVLDNFFSLGGDSIQAVIVLSRAREIGIEIGVAELFRTPTVAELAAIAAIADRQAHISRGEATSGHHRLPPSVRPLLQMTSDAFGELRTSAMLPIPTWVSTEQCGAAIEQLLLAHDALRGEVVHGSANWTVRIHDQDRCAVSIGVERKRLDPDDPSSVAAPGAPGAATSGGPSLRARIVETMTTGATWVHITLHPALVDRASWAIIEADLERVWWCLRSRTEVVLAPTASSFSACCDALDRAADVAARPSARPASDDARDRGSTRALIDELALEPGLGERLFTSVASTCKASRQELLVAVVADIVRRETGRSLLVVDVENPDRSIGLPDFDVCRTVGNLTRSLVVKIPLVARQRPTALLRTVKVELRRAAAESRGSGEPDDPRSRGPASPDPLCIRVLARHEVVPSGRLDRLRRAVLMPDREGLCVAGVDDARARLLLIPGARTGGGLLEPIRKTFTAACRRLVEDAEPDPTDSLLPSDFPLASINSEQLGRIARALRKSLRPRMILTGLADIYPLSALQQLWLANGRGPRRAEQHKHLGWQYVGALDVDVLSVAWQAVTDRHEVLRSAFFWQGLDEPVQIVFSNVAAAIAFHDFSGMHADRQEERLVSLLGADRDAGFDLASPPLNRLIVVKISNDLHRLVRSSGRSDRGLLVPADRDQGPVSSLRRRWANAECISALAAALS